MLSDSCRHLKECANTPPVRVSRLRRGCRYHRRGSSHPYDLLAPRGLCPLAFHALYPRAFALLCGGRADSGDRAPLQCPAGGDGVAFVVVRRRRDETLRERAEVAVRRWANRFATVELLDHRVFLEVAAAGAGCPYAYRGGERFEFNIGDRGEACPAAFHAVFPAYFAGIGAGGRDAEGCVQVPCPDYRRDIVLEFAAPRSAGEQACARHDGVAVRAVQAPEPGWCGPARSLESVLGALGIACPSLHHAAHPYLLALHHGGRLGFLTSDRRCAGLQCPHAGHPIRALVSGADSPAALRVTGRGAGCPRGIRAGEVFPEPTDAAALFWSDALAGLLPFVLALGSDASDAVRQGFAVSLPTRVGAGVFHVRVTGGG